LPGRLLEEAARGVIEVGVRHHSPQSLAIFTSLTGKAAGDWAGRHVGLVGHPGEDWARDILDDLLVLLCHINMPLSGTLAARTSGHAAGEFASDADTQGGDGVDDVPLRSDWRRPVAGILREPQALG
jgi:hypothetical protein